MFLLYRLYFDPLFFFLLVATTGIEMRTRYSLQALNSSHSLRCREFSIRRSRLQVSIQQVFSLLLSKQTAFFFVPERMKNI